ncbi:hypothetical protein CDD81_3819 [Ophiocordyceps australis]|uniref:Small-subunit processome Utp12 domain-containing protein n=1 Tax=Ophiocordyceps australis TaxID=1399860 RepID=A0A2C5XVG2_9HYPO|nr:hypothetical protein CDD81_3819 [Ophiocordyceps australis]
MSTKRKAPAKLAAPVIKSSAHVPRKTAIDESRTDVSGSALPQSSRAETIEISSDSSDEESFSEPEEGAKAQHTNGDSSSPPTTAVESRVNGEATAHDSPAAQESDDERAEPSFGELLRDSQAIDVTAMLPQSSTAIRATTQPQMSLKNLSHQSLTTVLSQALRTDDVQMLESCFQVSQISVVRSTIESIDSTLAGILLTKLAVRLHNRPGRAGILLNWVQWTLVAHGGALASQTQVQQTLKNLQKVLNERVKGLNSLLSLKGKLELLEGQMDLRKKMQKNSGLLLEDEDQDDDEHVIWVEGQDDLVNDDGKLRNGVLNRRKRGAGDSGDSDDEEVLETNGFMGDSDEEGDSASAGDDGVEDDSEDAEEPLDEDEADDVDGNDDDESAEEEDEESDIETSAPPAKVQKVAQSPFSIKAR